jgi:hypothetical protein
MGVDTKDTNPKDAAATTRLDLSLVPDSAVAYLAMAFTEGDLKYGGYNWRAAGVQTSVYVAAARRHIAKFFNGEWADPKTKVPHLANALACLAVIVDSYESGNLNDDRPPSQSAKLYAQAEELVAHLQEIFPRKTARYREDAIVPGKSYPVNSSNPLGRLVLDALRPDAPGPQPAHVRKDKPEDYCPACEWIKKYRS